MKYDLPENRGDAVIYVATKMEGIYSAGMGREQGAGVVSDGLINAVVDTDGDVETSVLEERETVGCELGWTEADMCPEGGDDVDKGRP